MYERPQERQRVQGIRRSELERCRWCSENEIIEKCTGRDLGGGHRTVPEVGWRSCLKRGVQGTETKGVDHHSFSGFSWNRILWRGHLKLRLLGPILINFNLVDLGWSLRIRWCWYQWLGDYIWKTCPTCTLKSRIKGKNHMGKSNAESGANTAQTRGRRRTQRLTVNSLNDLTTMQCKCLFSFRILLFISDSNWGF